MRIQSFYTAILGPILVSAAPMRDLTCTAEHTACRGRINLYDESTQHFWHLKTGGDGIISKRWQPWNGFWHWWQSADLRDGYAPMYGNPGGNEFPDENGQFFGHRGDQGDEDKGRQGPP